jgi:hypothetical protein
VVLIDKDFEGALRPTMGIRGTLSVKGVSTLGGGNGEDLVGRRKDDLSVRVDEAPNEPGTGDPIWSSGVRG